MKHLTIIVFFLGWLVLSVIFTALVFPILFVVVETDWLDYPEKLLDKI